MSYAVIVIETKKIAKDLDDNQHVYGSREHAQNVCDILNYDPENLDAPDEYCVKPI